MRTRISQSSFTFINRVLRQNYGVSLLHFIVLMTIYIIPLVLATLHDNSNISEMAFHILGYTSSSPGTPVLMIFPVLYGVLCFNFLSNEIECIRIHSLPVTRKCLFYEHLCGAMILMVIPYLLTGVSLLAFFAVTADLATQLIPLMFWLAVSVFFGCLFLSAAVLSTIVIGHPVFSVIFCYISLLLPYGLQQLISFNLDQFLKGYSYGDSSIFLMTSPLAGFLMSGNRGGFAQSFYLLHWITYGLMACLFICLSYYLYTKRKLENIHGMVQFPAMKPVLKYLAFICTVLLFGLIFRTATNSTIGMIPGYFIGGLLGFILSEMILQKTLRCQIAFKELCISMMLFFIVFGLIATDAFQYGSSPIEVDQIKKVYFDHTPYPGNEPIPNLMFDDPITVSAVHDLYEQTYNSIPSLHWLHEKDDVSLASFDFAFIDQRGRLFKRHYDLDKRLVTEALDKVYHSNEYLMRMVPITDLELSNVESAHITSRHGKSTPYLLSDANQLVALHEAIIKDIIENPRESFRSYPAVSTYSVQFDLANTSESDPNTSTYTTVDIYPHYSNTLEVLKDHQEINKTIITAEKVTKIKIKHLRDYDIRKYTSPLNSLEIFDENDASVTTITDPKIIASMIDRPLYHHGDSMDDSIVNIYTDGENPAYCGYYIGKLPASLEKQK